MRSWGIRFLPVVGNSKLVGALSRVEILNLTSTKSNIRVRDLMYEPPILLEVRDDIKSSTSKMISLDEWYVPVVESVNSRVYMGVYSLDNFISYYSHSNLEVYDEPVSKFMSRDVVYVSPEEKISSIWFKMLKYRYAGFPVVVKGRVVGVITQHDLIRYGFVRTLRESERSKAVREVCVREVMSTPPASVLEDSKLKRVVDIMSVRGVGRVIVVDRSNKLRGIIDREDVSKAILTCI